MSSNSHKISLLKLENLIEERLNLIDKEKTRQLNFIDLGLILKEFHIFKELFQQHNPNPRNKKDYVNCK